MKYFGEYLVSKGIINDLALVEALLEQTRGIPSVADIVFQKKGLTPEVFLKVFKAQHEKRLDFRDACMALSLWNEDLEKLMIREIQNCKIPLGHILVKNGKSQLSTLTTALDEFLSRKDSPNKKTTTTTDQTKPKAELEEKLPPLVTKGKVIASTLVEDFLTQVNEEKLYQIGNQCDGLEVATDNLELQKELMKSLLFDIHFIRGLVRFIGLEKFELMISLLESYSIRIVERLEAGRATDCSLFSTSCNSIIKMIKSLKVVLATTPNEVAWFSNDDYRSEFNELFTKLSEGCLQI